MNGQNVNEKYTVVTAERNETADTNEETMKQFASEQKGE